MKEVTRTINLQITFIDDKEFDESKETIKHKIEEYIKSELDADDVKISSIKTFSK